MTFTLNNTDNDDTKYICVSLQLSLFLSTATAPDFQSCFGSMKTHQRDDKQEVKVI